MSALLLVDCLVVSPLTGRYLLRGVLICEGNDKIERWKEPHPGKELTQPLCAEPKKSHGWLLTDVSTNRLTHQLLATERLLSNAAADGSKEPLPPLRHNVISHLARLIPTAHSAALLRRPRGDTSATVLSALAVSLFLLLCNPPHPTKHMMSFEGGHVLGGTVRGGSGQWQRRGLTHGA